MSTLPVAWRRAFVVAIVLVALAGLTTACRPKASPTAPGDNNLSRPVSPPSPGIVVGTLHRAPGVVAFLVGPLGGIETYGFFVIAIAAAVVGFMDVLGDDEKNGHNRNP